MTARMPRSSGLNLYQLPRRRFFEAECRAVAEFATRIEARVEQMPRHHVAERLEHRLLDARVLDLEIHDQSLDALALQAEIAACRTAAADDRQLDFLAVQPRLVLADVRERTNDHVLAVV